MSNVTSAYPQPVAGERRGWFTVLFAGLKNLIIGTIFCMTPVTAIIVLGWLVRRMRNIAAGRIETRAGYRSGREHAGWFLGPRGSPVFSRLFGGLVANIRTGLSYFVVLALATLPFTGLWITAWWAGWENSFNKGYEQSWVGPLAGLTGTAIGLWIMAHLPMALAHAAVERRAVAVFEIRNIRTLVGFAGLRYVVFLAMTVFFALPLFAMRGLPAFASGIIPNIADLSSEQLEQITGLLTLAKGGYVFVSLVILRSLSVRLHAFAVNRSGIFDDQTPAKSRFLLFRAVQLVLLAGISFGLVAQIFVGQFLNHNWWIWLNHPFLVLPWMP